MESAVVAAGCAVCRIQPTSHDDSKTEGRRKPVLTSWFKWVSENASRFCSVSLAVLTGGLGCTMLSVSTRSAVKLFSHVYA